ncbi:MAG TPA: hypothetical protein VF937_10985 [Chloroflexota bacterium]
MAATPHAGWRTMASRGYADLSPPEALHAILELPTNRAEYVGVLQDLGDYPTRSPIGQRVPTDADVAALKHSAGGWRTVALLDDERALRTAAWLFQRILVLDPLYDSGALLYAAWHDPLIRDEPSRRLAEHGGLLVRAAPLLNAGTALMAPDHLPGSWNPRPGWRQPRPGADRRQVAAWAMRTGLVLLYWADRLNALICTTRRDVVAALDVALGARAVSTTFEVAEPHSIDQAQSGREAHADALQAIWTDARRVSRRRTRHGFEDLCYALSPLVDAGPSHKTSAWRLTLGEISVPDPAMLIRRVMNDQDPERDPPLPRTRLKRRPLCVLPVST